MRSAQASPGPLHSPGVEVLLATYNGEAFLREQIDSLLAQDYAELRILASDDGSGDATPAILREYAERYPERFRILRGQPPGGSAQANFLKLMEHSEAQYVSFCDQDDVWLPGKVSASMASMRALEERHDSGTPLLVFTDLRVVDSGLRLIHASMWEHIGINPANALRLERLVGQAIVTGCTMTVNRPLLKLARRMPPEATMHDRWIALLAASMGASAFIREPQVLYRQHEGNVIGALAPDASIPGITRRIANRDNRQRQRRLDEEQIEALLRQHGQEMPREKAELLRLYLRSCQSPRAAERIWLTLRHGFRRQGLLANLALLAEPLRSRRRG